MPLHSQNIMAQLFYAFTAVVTSLSCPSGWLVGPVGNCYKFVTNVQATWDEGAKICSDMGGALITLESQLELHWLRDYRNPQTDYLTVWTGGRKSKGQWVWKNPVEGELRFNIANWAPGEPNDFKGNIEDCIEAYGINNGRKWNDHLCTVRHPVLCERNQI